MSGLSINPISVPAAEEHSGRDAAQRRRRSTPLAARGEPMVWLTGMAMTLCMLMIVLLLGLTLVQGSATFWPRPVETLTLRDGARLMGVPVRDEAYDPNAAEQAAIEIARTDASPGFVPGAFESDGRPRRRLYRVGNKEVRGEPFQWVPLHQVASIDREPDGALLERREWGVWVGKPEAIVEQRLVTVAADAPINAASDDDKGRPVERVVEQTNSDGSRVVVEQVRIAEGAGLREAFDRIHAQADSRRAEVDRLKRVDIGRINNESERARLALRQLEIDAARSSDPGSRRAFGFGAWGALLAGAGLALAAAAVQTRGLILASRSRGALTTSRRLATLASWLLFIGLAAPAWFVNPWSERLVTPDQLAAANAAHQAQAARLETEYAAILEKINALDNTDAAYRLIVRDTQTGRLAPSRQSAPNDPMRVSQVVRWVEPNALGIAGKLRVYLDRWREFLLEEPREANTEGGIFPVIFGTVLLTLLLSVAVVPLGVVAALYMREYARQGPVTSLLRIAVNNLAGVPSIVYGVFGLGFFCYTLGHYIDAGPTRPLSPSAWWPGLAAILAAVFLAALLGLRSRRDPGSSTAPMRSFWMFLSGLVWTGCIAGALLLIFRAPYFHGFFESRLPSPTFGTRGLLWAALTLALLTLPVVIVATEEAIAAVPRTMREGSYGCGASKWQTIQRIVLPRAMPGIMTGMILAMARGAGEVAPLMIVGAVKLAPDLPVSTHWPFLHLERSFMHLGFHIYDLGFQSPDAEAARPLVWTTTLVLIAIVLLLNLGAVRLRTRFRRRFAGGAF